jgi:hypothetical protein
MKKQLAYIESKEIPKIHFLKSSRTHIQEEVADSIILEKARVCIHRIPHESLISALAGRGITLDQRHAATD